MSGNILFLGNKIFEIPPFFQTRPGDLGKKVHACSLRFSALKICAAVQFTFGGLALFPPHSWERREIELKLRGTPHVRANRQRQAINPLQLLTDLLLSSTIKKRKSVVNAGRDLLEEQR